MELILTSCSPCLMRRFSPRVRTPRAFLSVASSSCLLDMHERKHYYLSIYPSMTLLTHDNIMQIISRGQMLWYVLIWFRCVPHTSGGWILGRTGHGNRQMIPDVKCTAVRRVCSICGFQPQLTTLTLHPWTVVLVRISRDLNAAASAVYWHLVCAVDKLTDAVSL